MTSVKQDFLSSIKWTSVERLSVQSVQFLIGLIIARVLSPSDYGMVGMLAIFTSISQTFIDSGFGNALVRKNNRTERDFVTVFYFNIAVSCFCYIALFLAAPAIASFFKIIELCPILRVISINLILNALIGVHAAKLTIQLNFRAFAKSSIVASVVSGLVGVILAYQGWGVWALVCQGLTSTVVNVFFIWIYSNKWIPHGRFSVSSFFEMFNYGSKLLVAGLLNTVYGNLNTLVIGKFFSANDLGVYSRGTQLATYPVDTVNGILGKVTFPIFAKNQEDDIRLIAIYRKYIRMVSMCIFLGCSLMAALGHPLILFLLTDKWKESIIYLQIFSFAIMFDHINAINLNLLQVKGRSDLFLRLEVIKKTISTVILFSAIPFGMIGICISKIIYTQIAVVINTYYTGKLFKLGYFAQIKDFGKYLLFAVFACLPAYTLTLFSFHPAIVLVVGSVLSIGVYAVILRLNRDDCFSELCVLIKGKMLAYGHKEKIK